MTTQTTVFHDGEGDAWFARNRDTLLSTKGPDWVEFLVSRLKGREMIASVCDVGCANGWRLKRLQPLLSPAARLCGIDVSAAAIADGRSRFADLMLSQGTICEIPMNGQFDLVVASFVLHWVDRSQIVRAISEIDRILVWGGHLLVADFLPDRPSKRPYHHLPERDVWTYKQDYAQAFGGLGFYREVARVTFAHGQGLASTQETLGIESVASCDRCACVLLQKTSEGYAIE